MKLFLSQALLAVGAMAFSQEQEGTPEQHLVNHQEFAGEHQEGPCAGEMTNGKPCVKDLLGYPIDIYREDWSASDRNVFWDTQFSDTGKRVTVPAFTQTGFKKMKMPEEMMTKILEYYHSRPDVLESHVTGYINNQPDKKKDGTGKMGMADTVTYTRDWTGPMRDMILEHMTPILEEWIGGEERGTPLEYTSIYGMRIYTNGSMLMNHADRADTHAVSAILNVMQEGIRKPWPLSIMGHDGLTHEITMEAGEMILYESARLVHGRPHAFDGDRYCNGFVHMRPVGHEWGELINKMRVTQSTHGKKRREGHHQYHELKNEL